MTDEENVTCASTERYSALTRTDILTHATTGMDPEDVARREIRRRVKDKCYARPLICQTSNRQIHRDRKERMPGAGGRGEGRGVTV